jgi:hypothetical protein
LPNEKPSSASGLKRCAKCKQHKPANSKDFKPDKHKKDGLSPWCRDCHNKMNRFRRSQKPDKDWNTPEYQHQRYREARQDDFCIICGEPASVVDHDHKTGHIRGRLCHGCNKGLGNFKDDPVLLELAALYLQGKCACGECTVKWGGLQIIDKQT